MQAESHAASPMAPPGQRLSKKRKLSAGADEGLAVQPGKAAKKAKTAKSGGNAGAPTPLQTLTAALDDVIALSSSSVQAREWACQLRLGQLEELRDYVSKTVGSIVLLSCDEERLRALLSVLASLVQASVDLQLDFAQADEHEDQLVKHACDAAFIMAQILGTPRLPHGLVLQDDIELLLNFVRFHFSKNVFPRLAALTDATISPRKAGGGRRADPREGLLLTLLRSLSGLFYQFARLIPNVRPMDDLVRGLVSVMLSALRLDGPAELGTTDVQLGALAGLCAAFEHQLSMRQEIAGDLVRVLGRLPRSKQALRAYVLDDTPGVTGIQMASALIMQLVQSCTHADPAVVRTQAKELAHRFTTALLDACQVAGGDGEDVKAAQALLSSFVSDWLEVLHSPAWPAADMLVEFVVRRVQSESADSPLLTTLLGKIGARVSQHAVLATVHNAFLFEQARAADGTAACVGCDLPYADQAMLACKQCKVWFHAECLGLVEADGLDEQFMCDPCTLRATMAELDQALQRSYKDALERAHAARRQEQLEAATKPSENNNSNNSNNNNNGASGAGAGVGVAGGAAGGGKRKTKKKTAPAPAPAPAPTPAPAPDEPQPASLTPKMTCFLAMIVSLGRYLAGSNARRLLLASWQGAFRDPLVRDLLVGEWQRDPSQDEPPAAKLSAQGAQQCALVLGNHAGLGLGPKSLDEMRDLLASRVERAKSTGARAHGLRSLGLVIRTQPLAMLQVKSIAQLVAASLASEAPRVREVACEVLGCCLQSSTSARADLIWDSLGPLCTDAAVSVRLRVLRLMRYWCEQFPGDDRSPTLLGCVLAAIGDSDEKVMTLASQAVDALCLDDGGGGGSGGGGATGFSTGGEETDLSRESACMVRLGKLSRVLLGPPEGPTRAARPEPVDLLLSMLQSERAASSSASTCETHNGVCGAATLSLCAALRALQKREAERSAEAVHALESRCAALAKKLLDKLSNDGTGATALCVLKAMCALSRVFPALAAGASWQSALEGQALALEGQGPDRAIVACELLALGLPHADRPSNEACERVLAGICKSLSSCSAALVPALANVAAALARRVYVPLRERLLHPAQENLRLALASGQAPWSSIARSLCRVGSLLRAYGEFAKEDYAQAFENALAIVAAPPLAPGSPARELSQVRARAIEAVGNMWIARPSLLEETRKRGLLGAWLAGQAQPGAAIDLLVQKQALESFASLLEAEEASRSLAGTAAGATGELLVRAAVAAPVGARVARAPTAQSLGRSHLTGGMTLDDETDGDLAHRGTSPSLIALHLGAITAAVSSDEPNVQKQALRVVRLIQRQGLANEAELVPCLCAALVAVLAAATPPSGAPNDAGGELARDAAVVLARIFTSRRAFVTSKLYDALVYAFVCLARRVPPSALPDSLLCSQVPGACVLAPLHGLLANERGLYRMLYDTLVDEVLVRLLTRDAGLAGLCGHSADVLTGLGAFVCHVLACLPYKCDDEVLLAVYKLSHALRLHEPSVIQRYRDALAASAPDGSTGGDLASSQRLAALLCAMLHVKRALCMCYGLSAERLASYAPSRAETKQLAHTASREVGTCDLRHEYGLLAVGAGAGDLLELLEKLSEDDQLGIQTSRKRRAPADAGGSASKVARTARGSRATRKPKRVVESDEDDYDYSSSRSNWD